MGTYSTNTTIIINILTNKFKFIKRKNSHLNASTTKIGWSLHVEVRRISFWSIFVIVDYEIYSYTALIIIIIIHKGHIIASHLCYQELLFNFYPQFLFLIKWKPITLPLLFYPQFINQIESPHLAPILVDATRQPDKPHGPQHVVVHIFFTFIFIFIFMKQTQNGDGTSLKHLQWQRWVLKLNEHSWKKTKH